MSRPQLTTAAAPARLSWLDGLRGLAAGAVVLHHALLYAVPTLGGSWSEAIDFGQYGVLLFFLVSGFVIAMSFDRYRDAGRFWIGRLFRLYPVFIATCLGMLALLATGFRPSRAFTVGDPVTAALSHLTMLTEFTTRRQLLGVFWTLSYEMVFYLVFSALFVLGLQRRAAWWALGLAFSALALGGVLPNNLLSGSQSRRLVLAGLLLALLVGSVVAYVSRRRWAMVLAGCAGLALPLLLAVNGKAWGPARPLASWRALIYLAVMFCGVVVYQAHVRQLRRQAAVLVLAAAAVAVFTASVMHSTPLMLARDHLPQTLVAVAVTFAAVFALRGREFPGVATWLGRVSYSMYMVHMLVLYVIMWAVPGLSSRPLAAQLGAVAGYLCAVLVLSALSYRWIERPFQRWGSRLSAAVLGRLHGPAPVTPSASDGPRELVTAHAEGR